MDRRDLQLSLVEDLWAAPGSQEGWAAFLRRLCDALHGSAANFLAHDLSCSSTDVAVTARTAPEALAGYQQHWCQFDPWARSPGALRLRPGSVVLGEALIARHELRRTGFYNNFSRQFDIGQCIAGMIEVSAGRMSVLSINGAEGRKPFDRQDAALLDRLMTPLQRALEIHRRLAGSELLALHAGAVLDRLPHGILFMAAGGRVLTTNRAADDILRARDGLTCEGGYLRAATPALTNHLRAAIGAAVRARGAVATDPGTTVSLPKVLGRPLSVVVAPLPSRRAALVDDEAVAVVFVTDPDRAPAPDVGTVRAVFGLTPAEAELVGCLARGLSLEQSARELGLSVETLRSRLKTIFQKTDTHRQADLIRLVLTAAAPGLSA
jgi:DNA-binding CsgD family transcriptional regulator